MMWVKLLPHAEELTKKIGYASGRCIWCQVTGWLRLAAWRNHGATVSAFLYNTMPTSAVREQTTGSDGKAEGTNTDCKNKQKSSDHDDKSRATNLGMPGGRHCYGFLATLCISNLPTWTGPIYTKKEHRRLAVGSHSHSHGLAKRSRLLISTRAHLPSCPDMCTSCGHRGSRQPTLQPLGGTKIAPQKSMSHEQSPSTMHVI